MDNREEANVTKLSRRLEEREKKIGQLRREVTKSHYQELAEARSKGIPVGFFIGYGPTEVAYAMGVLPLIPENYITICCAKRIAERFCEAAEAKGIPRDVCAYAKVGLGMMWLEDGPYGPMPKPDFVVAWPWVCDTYAKAWEIMARYYEVPLFNFDGPYTIDGRREEYETEWMIGQIKDLCTFIEEVTGKKFDYDRFKEAMKLSAQATDLAWQIQEYRKAIPCPWGLREVTNDLFYLVTQLGRPEAVEYFTLVRDHVKERVENKIGVLPKERFRLMWDNVPLWYKLELIDYFSEHGAVFPIDTYTLMWQGHSMEGYHLDPEHPFESLATGLLLRYNMMGLEVEVDCFERMIKEWNCDGAVFFSNRNCLLLARALFLKEKVLRERTGILTMDFEAEMADPRSFHEAEVMARIDAFLEMLERKKREG